MDEADAVRLGKRARCLKEDVHHATRRLNPVGSDERFEGEAVEVLHRVVEDAVGRAAVVVDRDRIGVRKAARELHFALEPLERRRADFAGQKQFDRGRAPQHGVFGAINFTHAPFADFGAERVAAEVLSVADLESPGRR